MTLLEAPESTAIRFYRATGDWGFLSNLYRSPVEVDGRRFPTAEHAYQFAKPIDPAVAEWIMAAPKPHLVAVAAHGLLSFDVRPDWTTFKVERMRQVLLAKFLQHDDLALKLKRTAPLELVEESKTDAFWGIGKNGRGKNMLGTLLMEIRAELCP